MKITFGPKISIFAVLGLFLLDRALKALAQASVSDTRLIGDALTFTLFRNSGIAFSLPVSGPVVWVLSVAILAFVCVLAAKDLRIGRTDRSFAYALFVFGACSNLFDRVIYGYTADYLLFFGRSAVNVADAMIVGGALLLFKADRKN